MVQILHQGGSKLAAAHSINSPAVIRKKKEADQEELSWQLVEQNKKKNRWN